MAVIGLSVLVATLLALRQSVILILLAAAAYTHLIWGDGMLVYLIEDLWAAMDNQVLLAIPMFIIAGAIMARGSIAKRLINIISAATSWLPGGMGLATIISCALFAAVSGSSAATLLAIGAVMYPALLQAGYPNRFALGAITSAGTLGIIIPPSIPLIIYGIVTETNIIDLFVAGIIPGILLTTGLGIYSMWSNRHMPRQPFSWGKLCQSIKHGAWSIVLPILLLGGIYSGLFSPTEAAVVSLAYALFVDMIIYRELKLADTFAIFKSTAQMLGTLFPIIAVALSIKTLLAIEGVPQAFSLWLQDTVASKVAFLLLINLALILIGCLIDVISAIMLLAPLLFIAAQAFGIHPVHFGIIMIINLEIGLLTPPIGLNLLVALTAFKQKFSEISMAVLPFMAVMLGVLMLVSFVPQLSLWLL